MRRYNSFVLVALTIAGTSFATAAFTAGLGPATQVRTDERTGAIHFIVRGADVAFFDKTGLHVRGDIEHGGNEISSRDGGYAR